MAWKQTIPNLGDHFGIQKFIFCCRQVNLAPFHFITDHLLILFTTLYCGNQLSILKLEVLVLLCHLMQFIVKLFLISMAPSLTTNLVPPLSIEREFF